MNGVNGTEVYKMYMRIMSFQIQQKSKNNQNKFPKENTFF